MSSANRNIKSGEDNDTAESNESQERPGEAVAGCPGQGVDCTHVYSGETHKFTEEQPGEEASPSGGWREVYYAMEVGER